MIEIFVPKENVNDDTVTLLAVKFNSGDYVQAGSAVVEFETSKTNIQIDAPVSGYLAHNLRVGDEVRVGDILFSLSDNNDAEIVKKNNQLSSEISVNNITHSNCFPNIFSKSALSYAKTIGLDLTEVDGGWITVADIKNKVGIKKPELNEYKATKIDCMAQNQLPHVVNKFTKRKLSEITSLQTGNSHAITSTIAIELDLPKKRLLEPPFLFSNGIADLVVYEASRLLMRYPELNASYLNSKEWAAYKSINFGWSFDNGKNLKVLTIIDANKLSLSELQSEVERLFELYESGEEIPIATLKSSTVTLSDLSGTDAVFMLPLINSNQSLILGLVKLVAGKYRVYATFDHRVAEGLSVTRFLSELSERVSSHFHPVGNKSICCDVCGKGINQEISDGNRGLLKITVSNDREELVCRNCFDGW